jgi:hypothetical protein
MPQHNGQLKKHLVVMWTAASWMVVGFVLAAGWLGLQRPPCPARSSNATPPVLFQTPPVDPFWKDWHDIPSDWQTQHYTSEYEAAPYLDEGNRTVISQGQVPAPVHFLHQPDKMVKLVKQCEKDKNCHFAYHHVPKSGGTTLEQAFFQVHKQPPESSCCNEFLIERLQKDPKKWCSAKFTSWQMDDPLYFKMLKYCFDWDTTKKRRVLIMVSYREPQQTYLSFVHQRCNKNWEKRNEIMQAACLACNYDTYTDKVWNRLAARIVEQVAGAWKVMQLQTDVKLPWDRINGIVGLEPNDLDAFLKAWKPQTTFIKANEETVDICYFRLTSTLLKRLGPAAEWYRRLVAQVE